MLERYNPWKLFRDVSCDTNSKLKPEEAKKREDESVVIYPRRSLPHQLRKKLRRLFPHELLRKK